MLRDAFLRELGTPIDRKREWRLHDQRGGCQSWEVVDQVVGEDQQPLIVQWEYSVCRDAHGRVTSQHVVGPRRLRFPSPTPAIAASGWPIIGDWQAFIDAGNIAVAGWNDDPATWQHFWAWRAGLYLGYQRKRQMSISVEDVRAAWREGGVSAPRGFRAVVRALFEGDIPGDAEWKDDATVSVTFARFIAAESRILLSDQQQSAGICRLADCLARWFIADNDGKRNQFVVSLSRIMEGRD